MSWWMGAMCGSERERRWRLKIGNGGVGLLWFPQLKVEGEERGSESLSEIKRGVGSRDRHVAGLGFKIYFYFHIFLLFWAEQKKELKDWIGFE